MAEVAQLPKMKSFKVNGKDVDLAKALPLTIGDLKVLKKNGCDLIRKGTALELEDLSTLFLHICRKSDPEITEQDIDTVPLTMLTYVGQAASKQEMGDPL